jgi:hypothetical protein
MHTSQATNHTIVIATMSSLVGATASGSKVLKKRHHAAETMAARSRSPRPRSWGWNQQRHNHGDKVKDDEGAYGEECFQTGESAHGGLTGGSPYQSKIQEDQKRPCKAD